MKHTDSMIHIWFAGKHQFDATLNNEETGWRRKSNKHDANSGKLVNVIPNGIMENVIFKVGNIIYPVKFMALNIEEEA